MVGKGGELWRQHHFLLLKPCLLHNAMVFTNPLMQLLPLMGLTNRTLLLICHKDRLIKRDTKEVEDACYIIEKVNFQTCIL